MNIRNIFTKTIEVDIQSTGIVEEEQIYVLHDNEIVKLMKINYGKKSKTYGIKHKPKPTMTQQQFHKPTSGLISCSSGYFKTTQESASSRIMT